MSLASARPEIVLHPDSADVPWWAVWCLDLPPGTLGSHVRRQYDMGRLRELHVRLEVTEAAVEQEWRRIVAEARALAGRGTAAEFAAAEVETARKLALTSRRVFPELCDLRALDGRPLRLQWFQVRTVDLLRQNTLAIVLLPAQHGKSWLVNMVVPLMDWAEQAEAVQIRIYQKQKEFAVPITRQLMAEVEGNRTLQRLFPHVRRPEKGDPCEKIWSTAGFAIGGRRAVDFSFRPLTPTMATVGVRGWRVIADDWVTEGNLAPETQDRYFNYAHSGVMTMRSSDAAKVRSRVHTVWGTAGFVGTIYDRRDYLARLSQEWKERFRAGHKDRKVMRFSVFPFADSKANGEVLWPAERPLEWVRKEEAELGRRSFRMRYLNVPVDDDDVVFASHVVDRALEPELTFGEAPPECRRIIGFDPASGSKRRRNAFPAAVVLGFRDDPTPGSTVQHCHIIEWHRWSVPQPEQVRRLAQLARRHQCAVVVETNNLQRSYADYLHEDAPDVRVVSHHTGGIKHNAEDGVEQFEPLFRHGLMHIHTGGAAEADVRALTEEFSDWPQGRYTDLVMAAWIARYQFKLQDNLRLPVAAAETPRFVERIPGRYTVDLSRYR